MGYGLDGNDLVVGLVARGCPEAIGCPGGPGSSLNFVHAQYRSLSHMITSPLSLIRS